MSKEIERSIISNNNGMKVSLLNWGARVERIQYQSLNNLIDLCLYYPNIENYLDDSVFLGAIVGRYCNRIAGGKYMLGGNTYHLEQNDKTSTLHSGKQGFHNQYWNVLTKDSSRVIFQYLSQDGEGGFPGNLDVCVEYFLSDDNELIIDIEATTDQSCPVSITGHTYFNLGEKEQTIENHKLWLNSDSFLPVDDASIPLADIEGVNSTDFDFRNGKSLKSAIVSEHSQIKQSQGIDHCYLNDSDKVVARLVSPDSNILLEVTSNMPGLQVYTGNFLSGSFKPYQGICLEPQHLPNSPNRPDFPDSILNPEETYHHQIKYAFSKRLKLM